MVSRQEIRLHILQDCSYGTCLVYRTGMAVDTKFRSACEPSSELQQAPHTAQLTTRMEASTAQCPLQHYGTSVHY